MQSVPQEADLVTRRDLPALAAGILLAGTTVARADFISAPDVVVYCDPALTQSLRGLAADYRARTGTPVRVLSAPGLQLINLMQRGTRTDVLVTLDTVMDQASARRLIDPATRAGHWVSPVVLAARDAPASATSIDAAGVRALLGDGRIAVIDPVASDRMDGPALLDRLGWAALASGRVDGMASGQEVAFAVGTGADRIGLLHRCDLVGHRNLTVVGLPAAPRPDETAPFDARYTAAIGHNVLSRNTVAFMEYLTSAEATTFLAHNGLEVRP